MIFDSQTFAALGLPAPAAELVQLPSAWLIIAIAYLLGAVPFGLLIAKRVSGIDLRQFGSGNIGTSNAVRAMGRRWGFVVFLLDFLKGFLPVLACYGLVADQELHLLQVLTGTAAVLGHCYPIYLAFRGGKGVATGCGAIVAINPFIFVSGGVVWLITRVTTRYAGLASIMMGITFPVATWVFDRYTGRARPELLVGSTLLTILILVRHRSNMMRMLKGTEPRIGEKVENSPAARNHG
ncbi:MAG: glycerol-3-phosphate 1-O-acyltransferase PlsY [Planctomycetota bacterium]